MDGAKLNTDTAELSRREMLVGRRLFCTEVFSKEEMEQKGMTILAEVRSYFPEIRKTSKEHGFLGNNI